MARRKAIVVLVLAWAAVMLGSYLATTAIDGPRNIDTGFQRLEILARYQFVALALALLAAALGVVWRGAAARVLLIGLIPLSATALLVVGLAVVVVTVDSSPTQSSPPLQPRVMPPTTAVD